MYSNEQKKRTLHSMLGESSYTTDVLVSPTFLLYFIDISSGCYVDGKVFLEEKTPSRSLCDKSRNKQITGDDFSL